MIRLFLILFALLLAGIPRMGLASSVATLREDLLQMSATLLGEANLHLDESRAQVVTSRPMDADESFTVVPRWSGGDAIPTLPLLFDLIATRGDSTRSPAIASLMTTLQRDVLTVRRHVQRGDALSCDDLEPTRRSVHAVPPRALRPPCVITGENVALKTLGAGDVLRLVDVGLPPDVRQLQVVNLRVLQGAIVLDQPGIALADGRVGDRISVRVNAGRQQLVGRVAAPRLVVVEGWQ